MGKAPDMARRPLKRCRELSGSDDDSDDIMDHDTSGAAATNLEGAGATSSTIEIPTSGSSSSATDRSPVDEIDLSVIDLTQQ
jgi:hypothetical protein